jgi:RNA polymerase sigma-70 factor (ECF subfamily)
MPEPDTRIASVVDHLFRSSAGQMVSYLTRVLGPAHLDLAEEAVQDALSKALQTWPFSGIPDNPPGWLLHVARNRALDLVRHRGVVSQKTSEIVAELSQPQAEPRLELPEALRDDELCMIFLACNPALPRDSRVALSLKAVSGFSVKEIARAFLCDPTAIAQRLVRAKRQIREQGLSFALPPSQELGKSLDSVLEVIYLLFNEGYAAHAGDDLVRHDLCSEALRLALLVADSPVSQPKAHALVSLLAFQGARLAARVDDNGELVLLQDQDRSKWDSRLIALGSRRLAMSAEGEELSQFHVQAAIASIHAQAKDPSSTDWEAILDLYDDLMALNPSAVVALNRIVALGKVHGPECALDELTAIQDDPALRDYYLLPSTRASLLAETGEFSQAANYFEAALRRPCSEPERRFLTRRMQECHDQALRLQKPS